MSEFQKTLDQAFPDMFAHIAEIIVDSRPLPMEYLLTNGWMLIWKAAVS